MSDSASSPPPGPPPGREPGPGAGADPDSEPVAGPGHRADRAATGSRLPDVVRSVWGRVGTPLRVLMVAAVAIPVLVIVVALATASVATNDFQYAGSAQAPAFSTNWGDDIQRQKPEGDEILRLDTRTPEGIGERMTVAPWRIGPHSGPPEAWLPLVAERYIARAERGIPGFRLELEGLVRINGARAYQMLYRSQYRAPSGHYRAAYGRLVLMPEGALEPRRGLIIKLVDTTLGMPLPLISATGNVPPLKRPFRSLRLDTLLPEAEADPQGQTVTTAN